MSIKKRIKVLLAFLVGIPLALLLFESYRTSRHSLVNEMERSSLEIAKLQTAEMDLTFATARVLTESLVRAIEVEANPNPKNIRALLQRFVHENPEVYGAAVAFDAKLTSLKRFAPYVFRQNGAEKLIELPYDYLAAEWYQSPIKARRGKWIKPYFGEGGQALMISYSAPVSFGGRVVGVAELDLDLDGLIARLRSLKPGHDGTVYLVNEAGSILAHPELKALAELPKGDSYTKLLELLRHAGIDTTKMIDPVSHKRSWIVEAPIRSLSAEQGGDDWSLVVSWPIETRLASLGHMVRQMIILYLFLGGAALWFLNRTFDDHITRPLRRLVNQARELTEGKFEQIPVSQSDATELKELGKALNPLAAKEQK